MESLNDKWLRIVGLPTLVCFSTFVLFRFLHDSGNSWFGILSVNVIIGILLWEIDRRFLVGIRKKFPGTENLFNRSLAQLVVIIIVQIVILGTGLWLMDITRYFGHSLDLGFYLYTFFVTFLMEVVVTVAYELIYYFQQWKQSFMLAEMLKKENLQVQLDSLKRQVNPHFLFNSLNALSYLIDNDVQTARQYVNELAMVYRNILDSNEKTLSTVREELEFLDAYFFLLHTRYGTHLKKEISISEKYLDWNIPPLTLQMLVENAVKHNIISASKPLTIKIQATDGNLLIVSNNLQKINGSAASGKVGLENIKSKYRLLNQEDVMVIETGEIFKVLLPLIKNEQ